MTEFSWATDESVKEFSVQFCLTDIGIFLKKHDEERVHTCAWSISWAMCQYIGYGSATDVFEARIYISYKYTDILEFQFKKEMINERYEYKRKLQPVWVTNCFT